MRRFALLVVSLTLTSACACLSAQHYAAYDLGHGVGYSINDAGQITGRLDLPGGTHVFLATQTQTMDLGLFGGYAYSRGTCINNKGQIVGDLYNHEGPHAAFMWDPNSGFRILNGMNSPLSISDLGLVAGSRYSNPSVPVLWSATSTVPLLQTAPGFLRSGVAIDVNNLGQAVGVVNAPLSVAALWDADGTLVMLPTVTSSSFARAINDLGEVVGTSDNGHAWRWTQSAGIIQLPDLPGAPGSDARDVNDIGQVVGSSGANAVVWNPDGTMITLDSPTGFGSATAYSINRYGQVTGYAFDPSGVVHAVLWTPVPEPSSIAALVFGLLGVRMSLRRRDQRAR